MSVAGICEIGTEIEIGIGSASAIGTGGDRIGSERGSGIEIGIESRVVARGRDVGAVARVGGGRCEAAR